MTQLEKAWKRMVDDWIYAQVPYTYQGRSAAAGLDCMGVVLRLYEAAGIKLEDHVRRLQDAYGREDVHEEALGAYAERFSEVPVGVARTGDLAVFYNEAMASVHVAIFITAREVVHSDRRVGIVRMRKSAVVASRSRVFRYIGAGAERLQ